MSHTISTLVLRDIARKAGEKILHIYRTADFEAITDKKADDSPLTLADKAAHEVIAEGLSTAYPKIPILSEEGKEVAYEERAKWDWFWCVDPLDGTKEFLKRNGEFTVNIALIHHGKPVLGIVYVPEKDWMYWNEPGTGPFLEKDGEIVPIRAKSFAPDASGLTLVCSRSHLSPEVEAYLNQFDSPDTTAMGSSLKFMLLAEGKADIYPRLAPTMEWDTAAAQAVLEAAGGHLINYETGQPLSYNKPNLRNPWFIAWGKNEGQVPMTF